QLVLENFADSILNGTDLVAPAEEGLNSVELANSMLFSSMQGETVNLPLDGDAYETMLKGLIANSGFKKETASGAVAADMSASFGK
ncbi:MAG: gfo/Idh/MocA family oxidoreductase, partial [Lentisphaeria bacterium]|nr:gfo/Idh/MocA family oxidoreductase [Lentisphaeria bacterium]